jgi:hypothetical protein
MSLNGISNLRPTLTFVGFSRPEIPNLGDMYLDYSGTLQMFVKGNWIEVSTQEVASQTYKNCRNCGANYMGNPRCDYCNSIVTDYSFCSNVRK